MHSLEDVYREMRNVVRGNESFIYDNGICTYVEETEEDKYVPSCLIGHVLYNLGIGVGVLHHMDESPNPAICVTTTPEILNGFSSDAIAFMTTAQNHQDSGYPWGHALDRAEELHIS